ncbi:3670_t:CDS:1, partial [Dentiscutata erythropus]
MIQFTPLNADAAPSQAQILVDPLDAPVAKSFFSTTTTRSYYAVFDFDFIRSIVPG